MKDEKIFNMKFAKVYDLLVKKAEHKGRTRAEVDELIKWLCGYDSNMIEELINEDISYKEFFDKAPNWNPESRYITGKICGIQVEAIEDKTMWKIRCLDKIIDELAKGKSIEKIENRKK